jgi:hypothetical protein
MQEPAEEAVALKVIIHQQKHDLVVACISERLFICATMDRTGVGQGEEFAGSERPGVLFNFFFKRLGFFMKERHMLMELGSPFFEDTFE